MRSLFLAPHNDDETLFGAYTLLREEPMVVVCYWGDSQPNAIGVNRMLETEAALEVLGVREFDQWSYLDTWHREKYVKEMRAQMLELGDFHMVYAPMVEQDGHEQHNIVGELAREVFPRVRGYATYRRGSGRTQTIFEVPFEPDWPARKFAAMACYRSQIEIENTRPWFFDDDAWREWYE